ncbi:arginase family protein [Candidatus Pacearchaeota archaeon]|nr:arginase family protein [Candidatus Pacearchaeota archaeon]
MEVIRVRLIDKNSAGCELAPIEILKKFKEIHTKENGEMLSKEKIRYEEIHVDLENLREADHLILENSKEVFERNFKVFFVGGDNSINYSIVKAFTITEKNPLIINFDAHTGCSINPSRDLNWMKRVIDEEISGRIFLNLGSREIEELDFMKRNHILNIGIELLLEDIHGICDLIMERARVSSNFFLTIDIDVLDPSFAPGVSSVVPGGMSSRQLLYIIKRLIKLKNFKGVSLTGINPAKDVNDITTKLGARILAELM